LFPRRLSRGTTAFLRRDTQRITTDRMRHAVDFAVIGLILVPPRGTWGFDILMPDIDQATRR
jgi:hypothetical protein